MQITTDLERGPFKLNHPFYLLKCSEEIGYNFLKDVRNALSFFGFRDRNPIEFDQFLIKPKDSNIFVDVAGLSKHKMISLIRIIHSLRERQNCIIISGLNYNNITIFHGFHRSGGKT